MRGITSRFIVSSLLSSEPELGELPETALFALTSVWVLASWDCGRLHTSDTPVSSAIRMASLMSALARMYRCHPCTSTLVVTRERNWMILLYGNEFSHWLVQNLAAWTTRKCGINRGSRNHNWNIRQMLWSSLFGHAQLSVSFEVRRVVQSLIGVLELRLGSVNLKRNDISLSLTRKIRANHLGSDLHLGAEAQFIHHAVQTCRQRFVLQFQCPRPQLRSFHLFL